MTEQEATKPIAPLLREMELEQVEVYSFERYLAVRNIAQDVATQTGRKFTVRKVNGMLHVTRIL